MYKNLSLKLEENIYLDTEKIRKKIKTPRNTYINSAVDHFNKLHMRKTLKDKLQKESKLVSRESLKVLQEFEKLSD